MDVSVIIVTYNTLKMTSECIDSIIEKTQGIDYEIILVDNKSEDGSKRYFENDKRLTTYIYNNVNYGFGIANNIGMKVAKGKYFFLLNSDTLLINNAIKEFFDYAEKNNDGSVYGCYLINGNGEYSVSFFDFPAFTINAYFKRKCRKEQLIDNMQVRKVEAITGADMFIPRKIIDIVGDFDPNIFMYGEEGELQYRMMRCGIERILIPMPKIIHFEEQSATPSIKKQAMKLKGHFIILNKHMDKLTYIIARFYYAMSYTVKYLPKLFSNKDYILLLKAIYLCK